MPSLVWCLRRCPGRSQRSQWRGRQTNRLSCADPHCPVDKKRSTSASYTKGLKQKTVWKNKRNPEAMDRAVDSRRQAAGSDTVDFRNTETPRSTGCKLMRVAGLDPLELITGFPTQPSLGQREARTPHFRHGSSTAPWLWRGRTIQENMAAQMKILILVLFLVEGHKLVNS